MTLDNLPVFEAKITNEEDGLFALSLVDLPAVEKNFVYFKEQKQLNFQVDNEDQHLVTGPVMRANFPIYRYDKSFGEYYILYTPETISLMAEKMMSDNTYKNINLQHDENSFVDGVKIQELFIKDPEKGIDPKGFEDIENGSLFATYKIENEEIWSQIKEGKFKGFSLEGYFTIDPYEKQQNNKNNIMNKLINKFLKSLVKMGNIETDKGTVYWVGEADLQIGDELFYDKGDEIIKVEDGDYVLEDGTVIVVKEGLVQEIKEKDGEQEGELDMEEQEPVEEPTTEPVEEPTRDLAKEIDEMKSEFNEKIEELRNEIQTIKDEIEALKQTPAAEPIVEEFKKVQKSDMNGIPEFGSRSRLTK